MLTMRHLSNEQKHLIYAGLVELRKADYFDNDIEYDIHNSEQENVIDFYMRHTQLNKDTAYEHLKAFIDIPMSSYEKILQRFTPCVYYKKGKKSLVMMGVSYEQHKQAIDYYEKELAIYEEVKRLFELELLQMQGGKL